MLFGCNSGTSSQSEASVIASRFEVLLNLFQALFLTDSDGAESISGIDIGHQQTLDFGIEMYTGDGSHLLLIVTTVIMLFATSIFSLVLLSRGCKAT